MANLLFSYLLIPFLNWGYYIVGLAVILTAVCKWFDLTHHGLAGWFTPTSNCWVRGFNFVSKISYKFLIWFVLGFKILYASLETLGQYYIWSASKFTKFFLNQTAENFDILKEFTGIFSRLFNNKLGFFLFYSWGRFWMVIVVSLIVAIGFYLFLLFLRKYKERFFEKGEVELGFLLALTISWPNFLIFLICSFLAVILISISKLLFFSAKDGSAFGGKETYTTLGLPFLLAAFTALIFGNYFINLLGLMALRI